MESVDRRNFVLSMSSLSLIGAADAATAQPLTAQTVVAWHGRSPIEHVNLVHQWHNQGFRPSSMSLYGSPQNPTYAAIFINRGDAYQCGYPFGISLAEFQELFNTYAAMGWGPVLITATGPANSPLISAVFRPMLSVPATLLGLTHDQFVAQNDAQRAAGPSSSAWTATEHPRTPATVGSG